MPRLGLAGSRGSPSEPRRAWYCVEKQDGIPIRNAVTTDDDDDDMGGHRHREEDERKGSDAGARSSHESDHCEERESRVESADAPDGPGRPEKRTGIRPQPIPGLPQEEPKPYRWVAAALLKCLADEITGLGRRRARGCRLDGSGLAVEVGGRRLVPGLVFLEVFQMVETNHPIGVSLVEGAASGVVDWNELAIDDGVTQYPGSEHRQEAEQGRTGQVSPRSQRVATVEERRGQQRYERECRGPSQRRETGGGAGQQGHVRGGTIRRGEEEPAGGQKQNKKQRLALDVGREEDETGMDRGDDSRRQGQATASEDPSREVREDENRQGAERCIGDLGKRDPVGMSERGGDEEHGIARRTEVGGLRRQWIVAGSDQRLCREKVSPRVPEPKRLKSDGGDRRKAHGEGEEKHEGGRPCSQDWGFLFCHSEAQSAEESTPRRPGQILRGACPERGGGRTRSFVSSFAEASENRSLRMSGGAKLSG